MIIKNKKIRNNSPVIKGTRIAVSEVLLALSEGFSIDKILRNCRVSGSMVKKDEIVEAIRYGAKNCL
jgi:uncharacterized protein (DUF433 family)